MNKSFPTHPSNWIMGLYWSIVIFMIAMLTFVPFFAGMPFIAMVIFRSVFSGVTLLLLFILYRGYTLKYTITDKELIIRGIFKTHNISRSDIKSVEKVLIPIGVRLFGASFLGGYYYLPGLGKAWVAMNNFQDGVLIKAKDKNYLITPKGWEKFVGLLV